jgi:S-DNA-T family DNA segregation ATPase FtsK/SpoIIIE
MWEEEGDAMRRVLHFQAERIEMVLASHKVPARVMGGTVTPRLVRFRVSTPLGVRVKQVSGLAEELALSLNAPSCRVYRERGEVQVEVPRPDGQMVYLLELCRRLACEGSHGRQTVPPITAVLGLDREGVPLLLRLPSPNVAHVLIAGITGSGKTALARSVIASLALHNSQRALQLVLVDPKGRGFVPFEGLPHLLVPVVTHAGEALGVLGRLVGEMERRDAEGRSEPRLVVVLDELADLVQVGGREMEEVLTRLTQRGREAGIHLVACTQKPTAVVIGSLVKSNFPVRVVGSVASPEDAKVATGLAGSGAERLLGQGDFLVVAKGQTMRMQAAYLSVEETREVVRRLAEDRQAPDGGRGQAVRQLLAPTGTDGEATSGIGLGARLRLRTRLRRVR